MPYIELESLDDARLDVFARLTRLSFATSSNPKKEFSLSKARRLLIGHCSVGCSRFQCS